MRKHKDFSGVVVWLEPMGPAADGVPAQGRSKTVEMAQKMKSFRPHVLAIQVGSTVDFPNLDPIFHNAFSNFSGQRFDVGLYPPGTSQKVHFTREGIARVFCNIHPTMSAVIVVLATPYFAVSNKRGEFAIDGAPLGDYRFRLYHERASPENTGWLEKRITVDRDAVTLPLLSISEAGYIPLPHKNKYGQDYPPVVEDRPAYSEVRR